MNAYEGCIRMPWVTIPEAAAAMGLSSDTIRRRIKTGELVSQRDPRGRYLVEVEDLASVDARLESDQLAGAQVDPAIALELEHTRELLEEVRRQRDMLETQVEAQQKQIEADAVERAELRQLLAMHMQQSQARLAVPMSADAGSTPQRASQRPWWRFWRSGSSHTSERQNGPGSAS